MILQGIAIPNRAPEITDVVRALMAKLEADKKRITLGDKSEDSAYCENFACTIFERADRADRAGKGDKNTAMTFYAASVFIDVSHHQDSCLNTRFAGVQSLCIAFCLFSCLVFLHFDFRQS